jgi:mRNA-degrading endonuclease toxin of MazEF toxin-antitoxin module
MTEECIVACLLKARIVNQYRQPLLKNGSDNTPIARRWSNKHHSATAVTPRNNRRAVVDSVFCVVRAERRRIPSWVLVRRQSVGDSPSLRKEASGRAVESWVISQKVQFLGLKGVRNRPTKETVTRQRLVVLWDRRQPARTGAVEHGSWGSCSVGSATRWQPV